MKQHYNSIYLFFFALTVCFSGISPVYSQDEKKKDDEKPKIPPPQRVELETKDQVKLICTYFPGTKKKESVPLILLHDFDGSRNQFLPFAQYMQVQFGCAVIVPDLRGHGESTRTVNNDLIDRTKFSKRDYPFFNEDISACFRYLRDNANNEGTANIDMLCVVATGYTSINAVAWTLIDYAYPPIRGKKQGQFVKGVVLLSPRKSLKGYSIAPLLKEPIFSGRGIQPIPMLIAVGDADDKSFRDGKSIYSTLKRTHPKIDDPLKKTIYLEEYRKSAGADLLNPARKTGLERIIAAFVKNKIEANSDDFPWVDYTKKED